MRVLVTGGAGLLGSHLLASAPPSIDVTGTWRATPGPGVRADLAVPPDVAQVFDHVKPHVVIHTAYAAADVERDVRVAGDLVATACSSTGARLVSISTDMVFDGEGAPYDEVADRTATSAYGRAKVGLENATLAAGGLVVRTSLLVDPARPDPGTAWVCGALARHEPVRLFTDELRQPLAAADLAREVWALALDDTTGVVHRVGDEALSRFALGALMALGAGLDPAGLTPASNAEVPGRPRDLRLSTSDAWRSEPPRPISAVLCGP